MNGRKVSQVSSVEHLSCKQGVAGESPASGILSPSEFTLVKNFMLLEVSPEKILILSLISVHKSNWFSALLSG